MAFNGEERRFLRKICAFSFLFDSTGKALQAIAFPNGDVHSLREAILDMNGLAKWFDFIWSGFWPEDEAAIAQEAQAQEFFGEEAFLYRRDVDIYQQFLVEMTELKDLLAKVKQLLEARIKKNSVAVQRLLEEINGFQAV